MKNINGKGLWFVAVPPATLGVRATFYILLCAKHLFEPNNLVTINLLTFTLTSSCSLRDCRIRKNFILVHEVNRNEPSNC